MVASSARTDDDRERGQALVEFAVVLPVLVLMVLGILLVSEVGVARLALEHGAAEAARTGALTNDDRLVRSTIAASVAPLDPGRVAVVIEPMQGQPPRNATPRGSLIRVRLRYAVALPLGFAGLPQLVVEGFAARRIEWSP